MMQLMSSSEGSSPLIGLKLSQTFVLTFGHIFMIVFYLLETFEQLITSRYCIQIIRNDNKIVEFKIVACSLTT